MSVRVMTRVWELDLPDSQKIVLLALADCANDEGHCWPSMRTLAAKCSKGERTVQGVIIKLCEAGHLTRREVLGKGCNYTVHPRSDCTPAEAAPRREQQKPPQGLRDTPAEAADKPSKNHKEPSKARKRANRPDGVSEETWGDFNRQRKKVFTDTALKLFVAEANKAGWPLEEAFAYATMRGWEGFNSDWVEKRERPASERPAQSPQDWLTFCEDRAKWAREHKHGPGIQEWEQKAAEARAKLPVKIPNLRAVT